MLTPRKAALRAAAARRGETKHASDTWRVRNQNARAVHGLHAGRDWALRAALPSGRPAAGKTRAGRRERGAGGPSSCALLAMPLGSSSRLKHVLTCWVGRGGATMSTGRGRTPRQGLTAGGCSRASNRFEKKKRATVHDSGLERRLRLRQRTTRSLRAVGTPMGPEPPPRARQNA